MCDAFQWSPLHRVVSFRMVPSPCISWASNGCHLGLDHTLNSIGKHRLLIGLLHTRPESGPSRREGGKPTDPVEEPPSTSPAILDADGERVATRPIEKMAEWQVSANQHPSIPSHQIWTLLDATRHDAKRNPRCTVLSPRRQLARRWTNLRPPGVRIHLPWRMLCMYPYPLRVTSLDGSFRGGHPMDVAHTSDTRDSCSLFLASKRAAVPLHTSSDGHLHARTASRAPRKRTHLHACQWCTSSESFRNCGCASP